MPRLHLHTLPRNATPAELADSTVVIVDMLRASTTIATALAAGADCVMPFAEVDDTLAAAERFGRTNVLLGGERGGRLIPGFDLGNSPAEYTPERVAGRRILFTTTNGARALEHARGAERVLIGATVNRTAVARAASAASRVAILCAGTDGEYTDEDMLAGGAIAQAIAATASDWEMSPDAGKAVWYWRTQVAERPGSPMTVEEAFAWMLEATRGGRNLIDIGMADDIARCGRLDAISVVPELDQANNELRPAIAPHPPRS